MIVAKLKYIGCYIHEIARLVMTFLICYLRLGTSISNQHNAVLAIYDNVTSIGMYFKAIRNTL